MLEAHLLNTPEAFRRAVGREAADAYGPVRRQAVARSLDGTVQVRVNGLAEMLAVSFAVDVDPETVDLFEPSMLDALEAAVLTAHYLYSHNPRTCWISDESAWRRLLEYRSDEGQRDLVAGVWWHWRRSGWSLGELAERLGLPRGVVVFLLRELSVHAMPDVRALLRQTAARRFGAVFAVDGEELLEKGRECLAPFRAYRRLRLQTVLGTRGLLDPPANGKDAPRDATAVRQGAPPFVYEPSANSAKNFQDEETALTPSVRRLRDEALERWTARFLGGEPWTNKPFLGAEIVPADVTPPRPFDLADCVRSNHGLMQLERTLQNVARYGTVRRSSNRNARAPKPPSSRRRCDTETAFSETLLRFVRSLEPADTTPAVSMARDAYRTLGR